MKKIILSLIFLSLFQIAKADNPILTVEYKYSNVNDTTHFQKMRLDNEFCCNFIIESTPGDSLNNDVTILKHTETGVVLGKIYGKPSKDFIIKICEQYGYLNRNYVDELAYKIKRKS